MKDGPDIAQTAALMGDPARANMLMALMSGLALTGVELAREAGVTPSTASGHLSKLKASGLVRSIKQGRCCYFRIADPDVANAIEALVTVAARVGHLRTRPGPRDEAMRVARSCYDHLAGRHAVDLFDHWLSMGVLRWQGDAVELTRPGRSILSSIGIDIAALESETRPLCRTCIDWSERRNHLGGSIGATVLAHAQKRGWAKRNASTRVVTFGKQGYQEFVTWYCGNAPQAVE